MRQPDRSFAFLPLMLAAWAGGLTSACLTGRTGTSATSALGRGDGPARAAIPDKTIVLTFDDAVKSHRAFVAPLLREYGFGATFFISALWMEDRENFMTWPEIAELHALGFEIGNHTWSHGGFNAPESAALLPEELDRIDRALADAGVPRPVSFGWPGNGFGPEALAVLRARGYKFARRGMQPEFPYGQIHLGPLFDPAKHDPLLIPTSGDAYPDWTLEHFKKLVDQACPGKAVIVQFHGVPDVAHPWVHTPPEMFRQYMDYLKQGGFRVIALRDLEPWADPAARPPDPMLTARFP
jgi:peptidoglycan/xylan/chitin deacetylase (PgdA/CDA1 family)